MTAQGTLWHRHIINNSVLTFWSSSSCSLSSLSRSSMSLCLKYLIKLRDAWRPFWMEKQAASSLNTQPWTQHKSKRAAHDRQMFLCAQPLSLMTVIVQCGSVITELWCNIALDTWVYSHKNYVSPLGVGRDCTSNGCKAIRVDDGLFCFHEFGQTTLQLQVNIWVKQISYTKLQV